MDIDISRATYPQLDRIVELQNLLKIQNRNPADGFLVSDFRKHHYVEYLKHSRWFFTATDGERVVGALVGIESCQIKPSDFNNMLLKYMIDRDFLLIKQVFIHPDYAGGGIGRRFYTMLHKLIPSTMPMIAVVVAEPENTASIKFHEKCGFQRFATFKPAPDKDGQRRLRSA